MQITILKLIFYIREAFRSVGSLIDLIRSQIGFYAMYRFSRRMPQGPPSCKHRNDTTLGYVETS